MERIIFIGPCGGGFIPDNGASVKNYHIINYFKKKNIHLRLIDTQNWRRNPFILLKLSSVLFVSRKSKVIVSANNISSYRLLSVLYYFNFQNVIYWVIGGTIADWIKGKKVKVAPYKNCRHIFVEGEKMKKTFNCCNIFQVKTIPNFKLIKDIPHFTKNQGGIVHFVFISRIIPEKGCGYIFEAVKILQKMGLRNRFDVTFYGPIEESYKDVFIRNLNVVENIKYKGFLDLRDNTNYKELSHYDAMLFPTFWDGEGFPGVLIDAFICGLPVLASDWGLNSDLIDVGKTGILYPVHDAEAIADCMRTLIFNQAQITSMSKNCREKALEFDIANVLSDVFLKKYIL